MMRMKPLSVPLFSIATSFNDDHDCNDPSTLETDTDSRNVFRSKASFKILISVSKQVFGYDCG